MCNYYIMNKDKCVLSFYIDRSQPFVRIDVATVFIPDLIPVAMKHGMLLSKWLESRLVLSHRTAILKHFKQIGIVNLEDIIDVTKCISLNDTYWVKRAGSRIKWGSVSPYSNSLNSEIANFSFDENRQIDGKLISHSPDFATSGNFPKCWKRMNGVIYLYKAGSSLYSNSGQEPYSEYLASLLADALQIRHVRYELVHYRGKVATRCACMCDESVGLYGLASYRPDLDTFVGLLNDKEFTSCSKDVIDMLLLDYLTMNTDRHLNNIGVLVNNDTQQFIGLSPVYDNNLSLLPYFVTPSTGITPTNLEEYISKWSIGASDGSTFEDIYRLIKCNYVRQKLASVKSFKYNSRIPRADVANAVLKRQLNIAARL